MSSASSKVPPKFEDETEYEAWKKDIEIWCLLTELDAEKQALAIHLGLTGRARMASSELSVQELSDKNGVKTLMTKLDGMFLQDKGRRQFNAFHKLYSLRRNAEVKIPDFIIEFDHEYFAVTKKGITLPDTVVAFMLLASCNLDDKDVQLVMSGVTDVTSDNMKSALKRIFGGGITEQFNKPHIKSEPVFEALANNEESGAFYARGRGRPTYGRGGRQQGSSSKGSTEGNSKLYLGRGSGRKLNPPDKVTGRTTRCAVCGSKFHWASKCPDSFENSGNSYFLEDSECNASDQVSEEEEVYLSLFIGYSGDKQSAAENKLVKLVEESSMSAILDRGCSKTVCGEKWLDHYISNLSDYDQQHIKKMETNASFTFGDGSSEKSITRLSLPCYIGGRRCNIETDVVKSNIPMLMSKKSMKSSQMCLDFGNDTASIGNDIISLKCSSSGHYLFPLNL